MTCMTTFDTDSLEWARGVEFGLLFARVKYNARVSAYPLHADLGAQARRIADLFGQEISAAPHDHGYLCAECGDADCQDGEPWLDITITPRRTGKRRKREPA